MNVSHKHTKLVPQYAHPYQAWILATKWGWQQFDKLPHIFEGYVACVPRIEFSKFSRKDLHMLRCYRASYLYT